MRAAHYIALSALWWVPFSSLGAPVGFGELVESTQRTTRFTLNDDRTIELNASISPLAVSLSQEALNAFNTFLVDNYVSTEYVGHIRKQLSDGVENSLHCFGPSDSCQIQGEGQQDVQYVIDVSAEHAHVRVLVPPSMMAKQKATRRFIRGEQENNALIMHHRLSVGDGSDTQGYAFYQNQATMGLGGGFLASEVNATTNDDNEWGHLYVDRFSYNHLSEDRRVQLGFVSENINRIWNATTLLDTDEKVRALTVDYGSTSELEFKSQRNAPRFYFSVSAPGRLRITREDGTPVLERNATAGQNYVSYDDLPKGIHTLTFTVMAGQRQLYKETHKIYNNDRDKLRTGEWQYFVSLGKFYEQNQVHNDDIADIIDYYQYEAFLESRVINRFHDDWLVGVGALNTTQDFFTKASLGYEPTQDLRADVLFGAFGDRSEVYQASFRFHRLSIAWDKFVDANDDPLDMALSNYLFGFGSTESWSANYSSRLGPGTMYANYTDNRTEGTYSVYLLDDDEYYSYRSLSVGYNFRWLMNSSVDLNVTYLESQSIDNIEDDELEFNVNISVPIGVDTAVGYNASIEEGYQRHRAFANTYHQVNDNLSVNAEVAYSYDHYDHSGYSQTQEMGEVSLGANYADDALIGSAFMYADIDDTFVANGDLSGTTIFSENGVYTTAEEGESYLVIRNRGEVGNVSVESQTQDSFLSVVKPRGNGDLKGLITVDRDNTIKAIDPYQEYEVQLDEDASDYHNVGESVAKGTSYPGTLVTMDVDMREIKSYISVFNDIEGNPISAVQCVGAGCVDVEELSEGVFKFRVNAGMPFELRTSSQRCLIPTPSEFDTNNLGANFCMPVFSEDLDGTRIAKGSNGKFYYYVGEFNDQDVLRRYQAQLEDQPLSFINKEVGKRTFLFIESEAPLEIASAQILKELGSYALEESLDRPSFAAQ